LVELRAIMYPQISLAAFQQLRATEPKRICFGSTHKNALRKNNNGRYVGFFNVPFYETIGTLFPWQIFRNTKGQFGGYFRGISDSSEFAAIQSWISDNSDIVFIRSLFSTAIAACEHYVDHDKRSAVGSLEHRAKYLKDTGARDEIVDLLLQIFAKHHSQLRITAIASVPPSVEGVQSLPNYLAAKLANRVGLPDVTSALRWDRPKSSVKELDVDAKWGELEKVGLTVSRDLTGMNILLVDDMYQSGATAHFVLSRLRLAGADEVHLLAVSKGRRDTDNK